MTGTSSRQAEPRDAGRLLLLARVVWNLRMLGLFLVGPVLGVVLAGAIFGLPPGLYGVAALVFVFSLALFAVLIRGEYRRLDVGAGR